MLNLIARCIAYAVLVVRIARAGKKKPATGAGLDEHAMYWADR